MSEIVIKDNGTYTMITWPDGERHAWLYTEKFAYHDVKNYLANWFNELNGAGMLQCVSEGAGDPQCSQYAVEAFCSLYDAEVSFKNGMWSCHERHRLIARSYNLQDCLKYAQKELEK